MAGGFLKYSEKEAGNKMRHFDLKIWGPIVITIFANAIVIIWITAVFKTTVDYHIKDKASHIKPGRQFALSEPQRDAIVDLLNKGHPYTEKDKVNVERRLLTAELWIENFHENMDGLIAKAIDKYLAKTDDRRQKTRDF